MITIMAYKKLDGTSTFQSSIHFTEGSVCGLKPSYDSYKGIVISTEDVIFGGWCHKGFSSLNQAKNAAIKFASQNGIIIDKDNTI